MSLTALMQTTSDSRVCSAILGCFYDLLTNLITLQAPAVVECERGPKGTFVLLRGVAATLLF